ncbi:MAG: DUF4836 family protein [Muribaculaceae bacterium]|nr:DUF4836 family protein [Muribaculaceae bacterium]
MKLIKCLFLTLAVLLLATSCTKDKTQEYIPSDAVVVLKADLSQLIKHSGIRQKDGKLLLPPKFKKMLEDQSGDAKDVEKEMNKLQESGIDFSGCCYGFMPNGALNGKSDFEFVFLVPLDDEKKMQEYLKEKAEVDFEKKGDVLVASNKPNIFVIKDGTLFVTEVWDEGVEDDFITLLKPKKSMSDNDAIVKALGTDDDVNIFMDTKKFRKMAARELDGGYDPESMAASTMMDLFDVESSAIHINLADNEINVRTENEFDKNSDYMKLVKKMTSKPDADLVKMMPAGDNAIVFSLCINGEAIADFDLVKNLLGEAYDDPDFAKILNIFKSINGPVTIGAASNNLGEGEFNVVVATKTPKASDLHSIIDMTPMGEYGTREGSEYVLQESPDDPKIILGENNNVLYYKFNNSNSSATMGDNNAAKAIFSNALAALYFTSTIDNMQMQCTMESKDLKDGYTTMWVKEDGKKLCLLDALTFFAKLADEVDFYY